ncbi:MAG TPA: M1 family metallopeptidase [Terriglobales bacterium]|nr:M1 family metallopeptidase [Terriglobales bacterium]
MKHRFVSWLSVTLLLGGAAAAAQSPFAPKVTGPLSQRVVAYQINARYDPPKHTVAASETLTYHNLTGQPLDTFPFHLYLNAFQPKATWIHEAHRDGNFRTSSLEHWKPEDYGSNVVTSFEVVGMGDLTKQMQFISPDDGNPDDKTVFQVKLPRPVLPGQDVVFKIKFRATFPEVIARTGYKRTFLLAGQWFPKVGVWWHGQWNCHQFHALTEFFSDFGTYDVKITLPTNYVIGSTGVQVGEQDNGDGTKTVAFHAEDVHDFAWTADPNFKVITGTFNGSVGPVRIRLLSYQSHQRAWQPYIDCVRGTMQRFDEWYGPYPYAQITVVDPPHGAEEAGGMEYPTFITGDSGWFIPSGLHLIQLVIEHEFGHQYWYGMVATNEFENAWLDEGINSYTEAKVLDNMYGKNASVINLLGAQMGEPDTQRMQYLSAPDFDPLARHSYQDMSMSSYGAISYGKTASMLLSLEAILGEQTLRQALHVYFLKYRFTHPTTEDFINTVSQVAGQDLSWYWNQAVYGTQMLDYDVERADSTPVKWYDENLEEEKGQTEYETQVILHRKGDFIFPVEAVVKFDDGETTRERWDGKERWVRYVYRKKAKVESVQIDPDYQVTLDNNYLNNSRVSEPQTKATAKIATYWTFLTQLLAQMLAWLV